MNAVPVTVLGGFLGAGKTTLLNALLQADDGPRFGVLVNDFGDIHVDSALVTRIDGESLSLANGCICCTIQDDLVEALRGLLARVPAPDHILIETSGVSEPGAVARSITALERESPLRLDGVLLVVDAETFPGLADTQRAFAERQLLAADIVVLNKVDLVGAAALEQVRASIRAMVPEARIVECSYGRAPLPLLLGVEAAGASAETDLETSERTADGGSGRDRGAGCDHAGSGACDHRLEPHPFERWSFQTGRAFDLSRLRGVVSGLPTGIFRVKGIVQLARWPEKRAILQVVGRRVQLRFDRPWGDEQPRSVIVCIGGPGSIDAEALQAGCEAATAEPEPPSDPIDALAEWFRERWN